MYDHVYPNCLELNKLSFNCVRLGVRFCAISVTSSVSHL